MMPSNLLIETGRSQAITTPRLVLEPLTVAHAVTMFDVLSDPEIYRYLDYPPPPSVEYLRNLYAQLETRHSPDGHQIWLNWVVRPHGLPPVGFVQATVNASGGAWIAYVLSSKYWGRGFAQMATHAMLEHLTTAYGVDHFLASVEAENQRSICMLERLAFRPATEHEAEGHSVSATERLFVHYVKEDKPCN